MRNGKKNSIQTSRLRPILTFGLGNERNDSGGNHKNRLSAPHAPADGRTNPQKQTFRFSLNALGELSYDVCELRVQKMFWCVEEPPDAPPTDTGFLAWIPRADSLAILLAGWLPLFLLCCLPSFHPSIGVHPSIYPSVCPCVRPSVPPSIHTSRNPSVTCSRSDKFAASGFGMERHLNDPGSRAATGQYKSSSSLFFPVVCSNACMQLLSC